MTVVAATILALWMITALLVQNCKTPFPNRCNMICVWSIDPGSKDIRCAPLYLFCTWQQGKQSERYIPPPVGNGTSHHGFPRAKDRESRGLSSWTHKLQKTGNCAIGGCCSKQLNVATMENPPRPITSPMIKSWLASSLRGMLRIIIKKKPHPQTVQLLARSSALGNPPLSLLWAVTLPVHVKPRWLPLLKNSNGVLKDMDLAPKNADSKHRISTWCAQSLLFVAF